MTGNIHSLHHFFFPFRWDMLPSGFKKSDIKEDCPFDDRTCFNSFHKALIEGKKWEKTSFTIDKTDDYNEFSYFYSFVRKTLYDVQEYTNGFTQNKREVLRYYEYNIDKDKRNEYIIAYLLSKETEVLTLTLTVSGISLHVFDTGIAILSFNLVNDSDGQESPDKILLINEFGRRIYPQFLGKEFIADTQKVFLAKSLTLTLGDSIVLSEDFTHYNNLSHVNPGKTFNPPKFIEGLFDGNFVFHIEEDLKTSKVLLSRVMDDRLFFLCWYGNNDLCNSLTTLTTPSQSAILKTTKEDRTKEKSADWWYAFVFGDKSPKSIANAEMQARQIEQHTYARWLEYGTLYGMSRDSFVCISPDINYMNQYNLPRLDVHMSSIYYQFVILCLAQKSSVLKFSAEIANLSDSAVDVKHGDKLANSVKSIYGNYIEFVNKIYFREVSSQIQALEMYNQFQGVMAIADDVERLDAQIATLFNYLSFQKDERQNDEAHKLTWIATWFLPASLIASLFGIGFITERTTFSGAIDNNVWIAWAIIVGLGVAISGLLFILRKKL